MPHQQAFEDCHVCIFDCTDTGVDHTQCQRHGPAVPLVGLLESCRHCGCQEHKNRNLVCGCLWLEPKHAFAKTELHIQSVFPNASIRLRSFRHESCTMRVPMPYAQRMQFDTTRLVFIFSEHSRRCVIRQWRSISPIRFMVQPESIAQVTHMHAPRSLHNKS